MKTAACVVFYNIDFHRASFAKQLTSKKTHRKYKL